MVEKLEGSKTFVVPVEGGYKREIEVNANSYKEACNKVESAGNKVDLYRWGKEK